MTKPEVHVSDISSFRDCRWRWDWGSNLRQYLEPDIPMPHFLLGRAVHDALSMYYEGEDALKAYETYIEEDLHLSGHLEDMRDMEEKSKLVENVVMGRGMVAHYLTWAPARDKQWEVLATEQRLTLDMGRYLWVSRLDGVWRHRDTGELWLKEFKTARSIKESSTSFIYRDPQPMLYTTVAEKAFGETVAGILYTFLWKKVPTLPKRLANKEFSKSLRQNTTAELYMEALKQDARQMTESHPHQYDGLLAELVAEYWEPLQEFKNARDKYFQRIEVRKTQEDLGRNLQWLDMTVQEMLNPDLPMYPSPSQMKCPRCSFKDPCRIRFHGGNYDHLIAEDFRRRRQWDEETAKET